MQYLASSLEKQSEICFTVSAVGIPPLGSNFGLFRLPGFIVSLVGIKKKIEGRKKRYKGKERRNRTRKKEREEGVKRKNNN